LRLFQKSENGFIARKTGSATFEIASYVKDAWKNNICPAHEYSCAGRNTKPASLERALLRLQRDSALFKQRCSLFKQRSANPSASAMQREGDTARGRKKT